MLNINRLYAYYGSIEALHGISMEVEDQSICCVIGSNGAGKTTLLKSISGVTKIQGTIAWNNTELQGLSPRKISKLGVSHVPEGRHIYPGLTVKENLEVGTVAWHGLFGRQSYAEDLEAVYALFPRLKEREKQLGWSLSGGEQQMLAIGRAMMSRPKILMLDEPSMGLAPVVIDELFAKIVELNKVQRQTILLVEQNARLALEISDYAYVLENGEVAFHGSADSLRNDERIVKSYLGKFAKEK